jgi:hypothetical protein
MMITLVVMATAMAEIKWILIEEERPVQKENSGERGSNDTAWLALGWAVGSILKL